MSNVFSFTGTVGRDAEVKAMPSGQSVMNVTVANNVGFGDRQQTLWLRVALWGKRGETLAQYLRKGQQVFVSGELTQREYQAADGSMKSSLELNATVIDLLGKRNDQAAAAPAPQNFQTASAPSSYSAPDNFAAAFDDDIPF
jgi:single-strand DNA-binding protein